MNTGSPGLTPIGLLYVLGTLAAFALPAFAAIKVADAIRRLLERREAELMSRRR